MYFVIIKLLMQPQDFFLPFLRKEKLTKDAFVFYFDKSNHPFTFLPGQYLRMTLEIENPDERGKSRMFSVSSSPLDKDIMITTRVIQSSFKKRMVGLLSGEQVKFFGPVGRFVFDETDTRPHVLLAGGIGITPLHSMLRYASQKNIIIPTTLIATFSLAEEIIFEKELEELAKVHGSMHVIYSVSRLKESKSNWEGEKGRISAEMIKKYVHDPLNATYYVSGPSLMVDGALALLKEIGIADEQIKKEKFVGY